MQPSGVGRAAALAAVMIAMMIAPPVVRGGGAPVSVWMTPNFAYEPATVRVQVRVQPHPDNRRLRVTLDSEAYYRSSDLSLEGEQAAALHAFRWPGIPSGEYTIVVELYRSGETLLVRGGLLAVA